MRRSNTKLISIGSDVDVGDALDRIRIVAEGFDRALETGTFEGMDVELSMASHRRTPYSIPSVVATALITLFQSLVDATGQNSAGNSNNSGSNSGPKAGRLFLEIYPRISDDESFRSILEAATKALELKDVKLKGYGDCYPRGAIGCSTTDPVDHPVTNPPLQQKPPSCDATQQQPPSLWEHIGSSHSLENLRVSIHGSDDGSGSHGNVRALGLPRLWEAIQRNQSLESLTVHLYEPSPTEEPHRGALSTMQALSESLVEHPSIRNFELRYRRDANPKSLLVPHISRLLEASNLVELKLERFPFYTNGRGNNRHLHQILRLYSSSLLQHGEDADWLAFPMDDFIEVLSKHPNRNPSEDNGCGSLEALRLCDVGLVAHQANELLRHLPARTRILDLSNNQIDDIPRASDLRHHSDLQELKLWKNPCMYNQEQERSLEHLLALLLEYPCLTDFGPWDRWHHQSRALQIRRENARNRRNRNSESSHALSELEGNHHEKHFSHQDLRLLELMNQIEALADQNRCKVRLLLKCEILHAKPSFWPTVLSQTKQQVTQPGNGPSASRHRKRGLLGESSKPTTQRQANVIFSLLRDNFSRGIISI